MNLNVVSTTNPEIEINRLTKYFIEIYRKPDPQSIVFLYRHQLIIEERNTKLANHYFQRLKQIGCPIAISYVLYLYLYQEKYFLQLI